MITTRDPGSQFPAEIARVVWESKYRSHDKAGAPEASIEESWRRIARALAAAEPRERERWERRFFDALLDFRFLPGGRILAGAGTQRRVTLFNCFVMGRIEDSPEGISQPLREGAVTMQQGGGVGYDFSTLRPAGSAASDPAQTASGPVSFLRVWDAMCATLESTRARRGAMMATLRCDHPDIEAFVDAKSDPAALPHFNLSVLVSDAFMAAVGRGASWELAFTSADGSFETRRPIDARELWNRIVRSAYERGEPGVIFIDRVRSENNLQYCESIAATNPCGEVPLPPYGACDLGSINLTRFVREPFSERARFDLSAIVALVPVAVRMLDNVYEVARYPLPRQHEAAVGARRIGLGITGLADALTMLGLRYGSETSLKVAGGLMRTITHAAYHASVELAREKGVFPLFRAEPYLAAGFTSRLPFDLREKIARNGIRNSHLTAIAPAGTISLLAGNVSSGLEPAYGVHYLRRVRIAEDDVRDVAVTNYACALYRQQGGKAVPPGFAAAHEVAPEDHLAMQAELQAYVDNAISKTLNVAQEFPFERFTSLYDRAYRLRLKGCTAYRAHARAGRVLEMMQPPTCCEAESLAIAV
jgi:ribonucleoside-diphosphate reductase alpha chain